MKHTDYDRPGGLGALIMFVGGVVLARTAVRLARDVAPVAAAEPQASALGGPAPCNESPEEPVSSGALTQPRVERYNPGDAQPKRGWRRQRAGAAAGLAAAHPRRPHPQR